MYVLQLVSTVIAAVSIHSPATRRRIKEKLEQRDHEPQDVKNVLIGYARHLETQHHESASQAEAANGAAGDGNGSASASEALSAAAAETEQETAKVGGTMTKDIAEREKQKMERIASFAVSLPLFESSS